MNYDIIGDIHGHLAELEELFAALGYLRAADGGWKPPAGIRAVFLGDLIGSGRDGGGDGGDQDSGRDQGEVIRIVRAMTDAGDALAVMGNHEYNTICYLTPDGRGGYLRPRVPRNELRHRAFIRGCGGDEARLEQAVAWMRGLPFFLELEQGKLRIVHACWAAPQIDAVRADPAPCRDPDFLRESVREGSPGHLIVKMLLRGPDEIVPEGEIWRDAYGRVRGKRRRQWWRDYPAASPPVVFGHYCRIGRPVEVGRNWACLDHCVDGGGALSCLRWSADSALCGLDECPSVSVPSRAG